LKIVQTSGIEKRGLLFGHGHRFFENVVPPTIDEIAVAYRERAVPMAAQAANAAVQDAGLDINDITHVVCTTVGDASNPGFDIALLEELGVAGNGVERYLLSGVGCAGGLACVRTATNVLLASRAMGRPAKILVVACEAASPFYNLWLQRVNDTQKVDVGLALFTDGASALVMGYADVIPSSPSSDTSEDTALNVRPVYELRAFTSWMQSGTSNLLRGDVHPSGWTENVSPRLPVVTASMVGPTLKALLHAAGLSHLKPEDCDWAVHPGGAAILKACAKTMGLTDEDHLRASWGVYTQRGNSSSVTVLNVLSAIRGGRYAADVLGEGAPAAVVKARPREWLISVAFGFGITVEMMVFRNAQFIRG
jgi:fungal type III polyketide synthase